MAKSKISRKNGKGAIVAIALGAVALSGVAFSAWILSGQTPATVNNISVSVGSVKDHRLKISGADVTGGGLVFDCDASDTSGPIIYDSSDNRGGEKMSFTVTFYIEGALENGKFAGYFNGFSVKLGYMSASSLNSADAGMSQAISASWIVPPVAIDNTTSVDITSIPAISDSSISDTAITVGDGATLSAVYSAVTGDDEGYDSTSDVKVTLTVAFSWGSAFSGMNPGQFANGSMSDSELDSIMSALSSLHGASGAGLSITLTPLVM